MFQQTYYNVSTADNGEINRKAKWN